MLKLQEAKLLLRLTRAHILLAERENSLRKPILGRWRFQIRRGRLYVETLPVETSGTGMIWKGSQQMWNRPSQCYLLYMLNTVWEPGSPRVCLSVWFKGSFVLLVSFFFASNRFFQEPVPEEDKNRNPQWSEREETRLKTHQTQATPNTHPI